MFTVSDSTNLWRLLAEYEPLDVIHHWQCKGLLNGLGWEQNWLKRLLGTLLCTFQLHFQDYHFHYQFQEKN